MRTMESNWDVVIVGGSAAGLSAGLMLARSRRRVAIVDAGAPRNRFAAHMHGVLGHDGKPPQDLIAAGRREVERYGGVVIDATVTGAVRSGNAFAVTTDKREIMHARRLNVATGLRDELPEVDGLREQWGKGVVACPYCDGYENRDNASVSSEPVRSVFTRCNCCVNGRRTRRISFTCSKLPTRTNVVR